MKNIPRKCDITDMEYRKTKMNNNSIFSPSESIVQKITCFYKGNNHSQKQIFFLASNAM